VPGFNGLVVSYCNTWPAGTHIRCDAWLIKVKVSKTFFVSIHTSPNVVKWLLLCIREVPGSNFSLETSYPDVRVYMVSPQSLQANADLVP
jgi:hypothetical protein